MPSRPSPSASRTARARRRGRRAARSAGAGCWGGRGRPRPPRRSSGTRRTARRTRSAPGRSSSPARRASADCRKPGRRGASCAARWRRREGRRPGRCGPGRRPRSGSAFSRAASVPAEVLEEVRQIVGVLLLFGEDLFHQPARGRILLAEVGDHLAVAVDGDALGDQVLADHGLEILAFDVLRVAARRQPVGREVGLAAELHDTRRDLVGVLLLLAGVLEELRRHALGVDTLGHEVVALVAQRADDLGGERLVQQLVHHATVGVIPGSHRTFADVLPGPLAQRGDVGEESPGHLPLLRLGAAGAGGALVLRGGRAGAIAFGPRVLHADVLLVARLLLAFLPRDVVAAVRLDALDTRLRARRVLGVLGVVLGLGDALLGFRLRLADVLQIALHRVALLLRGLVLGLDALFVRVLDLAVGAIRGARLVHSGGRRALRLRGAGEAERERRRDDGEFQFHEALLWVIKVCAAVPPPARPGTARRRRRTAPWR